MKSIIGLSSFNRKSKNFFGNNQEKRRFFEKKSKSNYPRRLYFLKLLENYFFLTGKLIFSKGSHFGSDINQEGSQNEKKRTIMALSIEEDYVNLPRLSVAQRYDITKDFI